MDLPNEREVFIAMSEYIKKGDTWEGIPDYSNNFRKDVFHIVDHIPANYQVWNIPITADFLPLCITDGKYSVDHNSPLLCVEMPQETAKKLSRATCWAGTAQAKLKAFIAKKSNQKHYPEITATIKEALPILAELGLK